MPKKTRRIPIRAIRALGVKFGEQKIAERLIRTVTTRGLVTSDGEVVMSCEWCCDDDLWEGVWSWLRWVICGPPGLGCDCAPDDPPEGEGG